MPNFPGEEILKKEKEKKHFCPWQPYLLAY